MTVKTISELWQVLDLIIAGDDSFTICQKLDLTERQFNDFIAKLRHLGVEINYKRTLKRYITTWDNRSINIELSDQEFFILYATMLSLKSASEEFIADTKLKFTNAHDFHSKILIDLSAGDINNKRISLSLINRLQKISKAIQHQQQIEFSYESTKEKSQRSLDPYYLIHSQHSYFVWGFCQERKELRFFKVIRMSKIVETGKKFTKAKYRLEEELATAWYLRANKLGKLHEIKVKFFGEAAKSIQEYKLHASQTCENDGDNTIVTWQLSELSEFASWLCHWLGSFEVLQPEELKNMIDDKVNKHLKLKGESKP